MGFQEALMKQISKRPNVINNKKSAVPLPLVKLHRYAFGLWRGKILQKYQTLPHNTILYKKH